MRTSMGLGLLTMVVGLAAHADEAVRPEATAAVVVDGIELFSLRGASSLPAEVRASRTAQRIEACAQSATPVDAIGVTKNALGLELRCGEADLLIVVNADGALEGLALDVLTEVLRRRIVGAVDQWRADRSREHLLQAAGFAAGALVVLVVLLWVLSRLFGFIDRRLEATLKTRLTVLSIQSFQFLRAETVWRGLRWLMRTVHLALAVGALVFAVQQAFIRFPWTRGAGKNLAELAVGPLRTVWTGLLSALPGFVFIAIVIYLARAALRVMSLFFTALDQGSVALKGFEREWALPTYRLVRLLLLALTVVVVYPYIPGSSSEAFKGLSLMLGLLLSLGGSSYVSNIIAGYTMTFRRAFRVGDRIQIGEIAGVVSEMRQQVTHVRTPKNEEVVIPNSLILSSAVKNFSSISRTDGLLLHAHVGIGYETPWRQVEAMLLEAARRSVSPERAAKAFVNITRLGDFAVDYELNVPHDEPARLMQHYTRLHRHVLDVFNEFGVQIMTPNYESDPPDPKLVPKDQWFAAPAVPPASDSPAKPG